MNKFPPKKLLLLTLPLFSPIPGKSFLNISTDWKHYQTNIRSKKDFWYILMNFLRVLRSFCRPQYKFIKFSTPTCLPKQTHVQKNCLCKIFQNKQWYCLKSGIKNNLWNIFSFKKSICLNINLSVQILTYQSICNTSSKHLQLSKPIKTLTSFK